MVSTDAFRWVRTRAGVRTVACILVAVALWADPTRGSATALVSAVGGGAFGEQVDGSVKSGPAPQVALPPEGGGPFTASLAVVNADPVLTSGAAVVRTEGGGLGTADGVAVSSSQVSNVAITRSLVTADQVAASCRAGAAGSKGSTSLVNVRVNGARLLSVKANTVVKVPGARVFVNEQRRMDAPGWTGIAVNGLRVELLGAGSTVINEVIVARAECRAGGPGVNATTTSTTPTSSTSSSTTTSSTTTSSTTTTTTPDGCPCSLFDETVPGTVDAGDGGASVELGVRFRAERAGMVTGIRFYKSEANTGVHVGNLWAADGTLLATATFSSETASGWQTVLFASPVAIEPWPATYLASYHTQSGHYSFDPAFFSAEHYRNPPLLGLADEWEGPNGSYTYGPPGSFPRTGNGGVNYWVDLVFR